MSATTIARAHRVGADHPSLAGHFPGHPIVPGVLLLAMAQADAAALVGADWQLVGVSVAKFLVPVGPDEAFEIRLERSGEDAVDFTIVRAGVPVSTKIGSGSLRYQRVAR